LNAGEKLTGYETLEYRKDGTTFWSAMNAQAIFDEHGRVLYYEGTVEDIAFEKRSGSPILDAEAENAIRRAKLPPFPSHWEIHRLHLIAQFDLKKAANDEAQGRLARAQRSLVQEAYRQTVAAFASALESKDTRTRAHSERVQRYALELARTMDSELADDPSAEYGFLLHDVGKIGIPDRVLQKPAPLTEPERALMQTHTILGEQMLAGVALLQGPGVHIVRSHHERWDGDGYPDRLVREEIPTGARIFAVADTLDAMTSDRVYRAALPWSVAHDEIVLESGRQFDPDVVDAFRVCESSLREVRREFDAAA
jgi:ribonuclease P protein subunit RPR2